MSRVLRVVCLLVVSVAPAAAQTADDLFDPDRVRDLRLWVNSRDLEQLRLTYKEDTYYQADVEWNGIRVRNAAIRSRGNVTRNPTKPGLRLDFNRYVTGQRFLGLSSLVLDNLFQDPGFVREGTVMALFTRMGLAAPREAYVRLYINGEYEGVYAIVEPIDASFLKRAAGDDHGFLFDYQWVEPFHSEYLGPSLEPYKQRFKAETRKNAGDVTLYAPIHDLFEAVNAPYDAIWREAVQRHLDVRQFLMHVAIEEFVSEGDGLMGTWAMNNFYLYRPGEGTQHQMLPWDRDGSFQTSESSILERTADNLLFQRLMADPEFSEYYLQALEAVAAAAADGDWLEGQLRTRAALLQGSVYEDRRKPYTNEDFDTHALALQAFARLRPGIVLAEVARLRASAR